MQQPRSDPQSIAGTIVAIRGSIVDAHFPLHLPTLHHQLRAGDDGTVIVEVASHLNGGTMRGIALSPTQGLARGDTIVDTGGPLKASLATTSSDACSTCWESQSMAKNRWPMASGAPFISFRCL